MIEITEHDFQSVELFPLKWRWTDARWNQLLASDLAQIRPLSPAKASQLFDSTIQWVQDDRLSAQLFMGIEPLDDRGSERPDLVQDWLRSKDIKRDEIIIVSWDRRLAVLTNWGLFCNYWDDFCYPISHNVLVWPVAAQWALFYHHEEILFFGFKTG